MSNHMFGGRWGRGMAVCCSLAFLAVACGDKNESGVAETADVKELSWVDDNATVQPNRAIAVQGEVVSNVNSVVDFSITDPSNREIKQDAKGLLVTRRNPPAGSNSFSLNDDMGVQVAAGTDACNGEYVLNIKVAAGQANLVRPLRFRVVSGKDCKPATNQPAEQHHGAVYNVLGPREGAFDLVKGAPVPKRAADTTKDLVDITTRGSETAGGGFKKVLSSGNGARFIVDNGTPFDQVSAEHGQELFNGSAGDDETSTLKVGDIVYVKLADDRQADAIYALRVTRVDDTTSPSSHGYNGGVIEFDYRKL